MFCRAHPSDIGAGAFGGAVRGWRDCPNEKAFANMIPAVDEVLTLKIDDRGCVELYPVQ